MVLLPLCVLPLRNTDYTDYALLGLAVAYVLSNVVNVVHAWWRLKHSNLGMPHVTGRQLLRATVASVIGATWAYIAFAELPHPMPGGQVVRLAIAGVLGLLPVAVLEIMPPLLRHRAAGKERRAETKQVKQAEAVKARVAARVVIPHARPIHPAFVIVVVVAAAAGGTLTALAFVQGWGMIATVAPAGLLVGAGLFSLAMARFEIFVLALLVDPDQPRRPQVRRRQLRPRPGRPAGHAVPGCRRHLAARAVARGEHGCGSAR